MRGLAQLLAAHREARLCESHIFEHPACVLACAHLQEHAAAFVLLRRLPGVSAIRLNENRNADPRARPQRRKKSKWRERTGQLMTGFCAQWQQKPMERPAKFSCYPGNRTSSGPYLGIVRFRKSDWLVLSRLLGTGTAQ